MFDPDPDIDEGDDDPPLTDPACALDDVSDPEADEIAIPPTPQPVPVRQGGPDRLRAYNRDVALGRRQYIARLRAIRDRCMICMVLGEGLITDVAQRHPLQLCRHIQRGAFFKAKREAIQRQSSRGGWLKKFTACFQCGQPQEVCSYGVTAELAEHDQDAREIPSTEDRCQYRDTALPAAWALFHRSSWWGKTLGEITGAPQSVWENEDRWMDWLGTECVLYGMRACQAARLLDFFLECEYRE